MRGRRECALPSSTSRVVGPSSICTDRVVADLARSACAANIARMNPPEERRPVRSSFLSAEAIVGTGITIAMIGLLLLMLGWAQHMREVKEATWVLVPLGALLLIAGALGIAFGRPGRR